MSLPYLVYVGGRYAAYKDFARLVGEFAKCPRDLRLSLVVAGPRWSKSERGLLAESGVEPEARACGAPVIAARTAPFLEVAGDAPLYFDPDDTAGLAEAIQMSLEPDVREACRRPGGDRLAWHFWDATATAMPTAYERAASEEA